MKKGKGLLVFLSIVLYNCLLAQPSPFRFSRIDISNGLSNNGVNNIFKDSKGFLWFGTLAGLNRFDGYRFKVFRNDAKDSSSIGDDDVTQICEGPEDKLWIFFKTGFDIYDPKTEKFDHHPMAFLHSINIDDDNITSVHLDKEGNFWFPDLESGLYKYNPSTKSTTHFTHKESDTTSLHSNQVSSIAESPNAGWWIVYNDGVIDKLDNQSNKITYRNTTVSSYFPKQHLKFRLFADSDNDLWVCPADNNYFGIYYCNTRTGAIHHFRKDGTNKGLNNDLVNGIVQDLSGRLWIATDHGGINLINKKDFSVYYLLNREDDDKTISQNSLVTIYRDYDGVIWIGTFKKGISYFHDDIIKFPLFRKQLLNPSGLNYSDVNRFEEDDRGNIWVGTNGGGLTYYNRQTGEFKKYVHDPANPNSICNDVVVSLCIDHEKKLWIGTYYGGLDCFDGKTFTHYRHNTSDANSIGDDRVWDIKEDAEGRLWIGTFAAGLELFDRKNNKFIHYKAGNTNSVTSNYVTALVNGRDEKLWMATDNGFDMLDKRTGKFTQYGHDENNPSNSLSYNNCICLFEDSRGIVWIGTREGLNAFNPKTQKFQVFSMKDGLPDNTIVTILEDNAQHLWLGSPKGLTKLSITENKNNGALSCQFENYDETDGLQGREFNEKAAFKTKEGELIFGGANGFNIFQPENIKNDYQKPLIALTGFQLFNIDMGIGQKLNGHVVLPESITTSKKITLRYNENVFSIEFAALGFPMQKKIKYQYMLEGFDKQWLAADDKNRKATFTNLDPGDYIFKVRTSDNNGSWSNESKTLAISILPPFWKTGYAYFAYVLLAIGVLLFARRLLLQRAHMRYAIEHERREAQRLHELDMIKIRFFTNMSHEFRTPLSLILSPLDKIIKTAIEPLQKKQFQLIHRNARRLLYLVNQLLDFRKMETQELKLHLTEGDLPKFIKEISYSFTDLAENKNIHFDYKSSIPSFLTQFDHDKIERILFNLLSNAFKFTPENGSVCVELGMDSMNGETMVQIKIKDSGIGIPADKQEKIFERFFQNELPDSMLNLGSGIGLAISKEFVKLHGGSIVVESEVNKGSVFTVQLPFVEMSKTDMAPLEQGVGELLAWDNGDAQGQVFVEPLQIPEDGACNKKPTLLLVEDNDDFRFYLKDNLRAYFNIIEASDGRVGWQRTLSSHPDLVVSDITMPYMDGIDLCKKIKNDKRTSFVPVILLTALTGDGQQLKGLETGANDYMSKPFSFEILLAKIKNLLSQQEKARKTFQKQVQASPSEIKLESPELKFMNKALELVEKNISNDRFSVEEMSRELFISRVALYKKILLYTGKTPVEFIRSIRLKRAAQLLEKTNLTIAEIAYEVGFNNPKYFSKYFKAEFGVLPSSYHPQKQKELG
ncbi:MAG: helix-turn-helix domain-containing protein [Bacteroidetes bacterium]|nr:helix-turn-helix domain-containing protein [Bacteroidota bacterium]